jgi:hypothetical protein
VASRRAEGKLRVCQKTDARSDNRNL